mmetsp:Transcript_10581/g.23270  ORF Transcript_10581/g.23270 Transcript_10581/m.23270 type:complete len:214 (+) Transcript_10581:748-1389(+)
MHSLHLLCFILSLWSTRVISTKPPKSPANRKTVLHNLMFLDTSIKSGILQYVRRHKTLINTVVEPSWMCSSQISNNRHERSSTSFLPRRTLGIKRVENLQRKVLTQWMNTDHHICTFVIALDIHRISRQTPLKWLETCQLQHELIQPQPKRCCTKFVKPLPQKAVLCHNFVQRNVRIVRPEGTVICVDVNDVTVDFEREASRLRLVKYVEGIA